MPCVVRPPPSYHFPALLAFSGFLCVNYAWPVQNVRLSHANKLPHYSYICWLYCSLQDEYAREFTKFKPDKKLQWLSHLGTVQLDIELEDRTVSTEVLPLEAALIELFSERGGYCRRLSNLSSSYYIPAVWQFDDLVKAAGSLNRGVVIKGLATWVDLGVLKEDPENTFVLLEREEQALSSSNLRDHPHRGEFQLPMVIQVSRNVVTLETEDEPVKMSAAQQQHAEQMRVHWRVSRTS